MIIIGIDPGNTGAAAIYEGGQWVVHDCPTAKVKVGKSNKTVSDPGMMAEVLRPYIGGDVHVYLEKVSAMPGQGVTSMFTFGTNYGAWQGVVGAFGFVLNLVTPQAWKKELMEGMSKEKDAARLRASQLFPSMRSQLSRKKDIGRADALLIAEYGRRRMK